MKQLKLPISVGHSKNFGINNINNGKVCFEGYQNVGLLEGLVKGKNTQNLSLDGIRGIRKFYDGNIFYIGVFFDDKVSIYDSNLTHIVDHQYTEQGDINKLTDLNKIKFNITDTLNKLYSGQVADVDDYIGFESTNYIIVDTTNGNLTPGVYKDKVLSIGGSEYAIIGNTFNKIFIQDIFDSDINGGDYFDIYDTKNVSVLVGNFATQDNDYKYLNGPFKNRLIGYNPSNGKIVYSYIGIATTNTNKYNSFIIGEGYNGLKVLNIQGQEKLFIYGNGEIKILDFVGDILGVVAHYNLNKNIIDLEYYNGVVVVLTDEGLFGLDGKKINKLFDFTTDSNNSFITKEGKYLILNSIIINGNESCVIIDGFERNYILKGVVSYIINSNITYVLEDGVIKKYEFIENGYTDSYNNHNIELEFNPIYNLESFNNISMYVDNIIGKDKSFLIGNVEVRIILDNGDEVLLQESDYNFYNGYFVLNYDIDALKHKINGKLILKVKSNIPIFGIYLTTTK